MGNSKYKDPHIDIYLETNHIYYIAGQQVQGNIYLNVLKNRSYENLKLTLMGQQHVYWVSQKMNNEQQKTYDIQQRRKSLELIRTADPNKTHKTTYKRSYSNKYKNYQSSFGICQFAGNIKKGQYMFPFSFILPNMMSGTFNYGKNNYIVYFLIAELVYTENYQRNQTYSVPLNIQEPVRISQNPTRIKIPIQFQKTCFNPFKPGTKNVQIKINNLYAKNGESIILSNNYNGKHPLSFGVKLVQKRAMISKQRNACYPTDKTYDLGEFTLKSQSQSQINIPEKITQSTAIGSITSLYYLLLIEIFGGCCKNIKSDIVQLHIFITAKQPKVFSQQRIPPPKNWKPTINPLASCQTMKPFKQRVTKKLPYFNLPEQYTKQQSQMISSEYIPNFHKKQTLFSQASQKSIQPYKRQQKKQVEDDFNTENMDTDRKMLNQHKTKEISVDTKNHERPNKSITSLAKLGDIKEKQSSNKDTDKEMFHENDAPSTIVIPRRRRKN